MSPEQFTGKPIDARSDIYSIAVIGYEMLAGRLPFTAATPWEWATQHMTVAPTPLTTTPSGVPLPPSMINAIMRGLAKDPNERFATTGEFYQALALGGTAQMSQAGSMPSGPPSAVDQKGKTQIGTPASNPPFAPAGSGYGPPPAAPPYGPGPGGVYGAPPGPGMQGMVPVGTPAAGNLAYPAAPARKGRGGGGLVVLLVLFFLALGGGGVYFALNHGPTPTANNGKPTTPGPADAGATPASVDAGSPATASSTGSVDAAPLIDPSLPPLIDTNLPPTRLKGVKADGGATPAPSTPKPPPSVTPPPPPFDPPACKRAREIEAEHAKGLTAMRRACLAAGGHM